MPLPLLWLGAAAATALAVKELVDDRKSQHQLRSKDYRVQTLADLKPYQSAIAIYPADMLVTEQLVKPSVGAIVCCGIGGVLDHSGIWVGDNTIIEVDGNGLVRPVSTQRFTAGRSGKGIFIACDSFGVPLASAKAAERAIEQIYQVRDYHLLDNNCHQFIWQCLASDAKAITTFKALSLNMAQRFDRVVFWDGCDC